MTNEIAEFEAYTGKISYAASSKRDNSYLGRFTYGMLLSFEGLSRVLTVIARGYMWQNSSTPDIDRARNALYAWCSITKKKNTKPKKEWQFKSDYCELYDDFPELVDEKGCGWFYRHVHNVIGYVLSNPDKVMKQSVEACEKLRSGFDREWRKKVLQFQIPLFDPNTKGAWVLRFDDIIADALEMGPLKNVTVNVPDNILQEVLKIKPDDIPDEIISELLKFYFANKTDESEWVILPVINFDAYFGSSSFSKKWLSKLPDKIFEKQSRYGVCRFRVKY